MSILKHGKTPNSARPAGARNKTLRQWREVRQGEARTRQTAYDKLSLQQKIDAQVKAGHSGKQLAKLLAKQQKGA